MGLHGLTHSSVSIISNSSSPTSRSACRATYTVVRTIPYDARLRTRAPRLYPYERIAADKASGIVNDANDWSREVGDPRYILDLLALIVTVSLETMRIVDELPLLVVPRVQQ